MKKILSIGLAFFLLGAGCQSETSNNEITPVADANTSATDDTPTIPTEPGPWDGSIYATASTDGLTFTGKSLVLERAGVPNLLRLENGNLILTYQYFSDQSSELFNVIAYSISTDEGETWSDPAAIKLSGLAEPFASGFTAMDPTLVQLEDGRLRIYFTYHATGRRAAELYSATAPDSEISSTFEVENTPALTVSGKGLLDPAVVYFNGVWQHFSWQMDSDDNYHSTSTDGTSFQLSESINLPMDFLGQAVVVGDGLRFYGTGKGGVVSAYSTDGQNWTMDSGTRIQGADPGVAQLADGSYLMIYTSINFNK